MEYIEWSGDGTGVFYKKWNFNQQGKDRMMNRNFWRIISIWGRDTKGVQVLLEHFGFQLFCGSLRFLWRQSQDLKCKSVGNEADQMNSCIFIVFSLSLYLYSSYTMELCERHYLKNWVHLKENDQQEKSAEFLGAPKGHLHLDLCQW